VGPIYAKPIGHFTQDFDVIVLKTLPSGGRRLAFDSPLESVLFLHLSLFYRVDDFVECGMHGRVPADKS
jgi:hypothetical protein